MFDSLELLIEDAKKSIPVSSRRSWTAKTHNSHFQMEARYQEHSWTLDSKTFGTYVNEFRPKLWVIR